MNNDAIILRFIIKTTKIAQTAESLGDDIKPYLKLIENALKMENELTQNDWNNLSFLEKNLREKLNKIHDDDDSFPDSNF